MAKVIKLFTQEECPKCPPAKELVSDLKKQGYSVKEFNIKGNTDAMSEAAFHEVLGTPTIIIVDENDEEINSWRSKVPSKEEILKSLE